MILEIIFYALFISSALFLVMPIINSVAAYIGSGNIEPTDNFEYDYGIIITAYKQEEFVYPLINSLNRQSYTNFHIYVVADLCSLDENKITDNVTVLNPSLPLNSKVKSILYAIDNFQYKHDAAVIFDPDNLAHPEFMYEINKYFQNGFKIVQGKRTAKNLNTGIAALDALHEMFYNVTQRDGTTKLGSSAVIAGSGMAVDLELYKRTLDSNLIINSINKVISAEDKILQYESVNLNKVIAYNRNAIVYDEKSDNRKQLQKQRSRWHSSYFEYAKLGWKLFVRGITRRNFNQFYFGLNVITPPLFITLLLNSFLMILFFLTGHVKFAIAELSLLITFTLNMFFIMIYEKAPKAMWEALFHVPFFIIIQIRSLFNMKKAKSDFLVTKHSKVYSLKDLIGN